MTTKWKVSVLAGAGLLLSLITSVHAAPISPGALAPYAAKDGSSVQKTHFRRHHRRHRHHRHYRRSYGYGYGYGIPFIALGFGGRHHGHHGGFGHGGFGHGGFGGHGGHHGHH